MKNDKLVRLSSVLEILSKKDAPWSGFVNVQDLPAVDAVEVRHGRWEGDYPQATFRLKRCSVCGTLAPEGWYCFFCGAKIDGQRREDGEA